MIPLKHKRTHDSLFCKTGLSLLALLLLGQSVISPALAAESIQEMINRANDAANRQEFPTAIHIYEQVIPKAPGQKTLKTNLAVLYANYGVSLQEQKKFDEALPYYDKALALITPDSHEAKSIQDAKAGTYFAKANTLRDSIQTPTAADYAQMKSLVEKALAINPDEPNFKKGLASLYLDEGYQLATAEKYAEALPLMEKALSIDPQFKAAQHSLANVYLGLARTDDAHKKEWLDKAVATDNSPQIKQVADHLASFNLNSAAPSTGGFAASPNEARQSAPKGLTTLSVAEMIHDSEAQLQITPPKNATLLERLATLERQVLGKQQEGPLATRTKAVYTALMGSYDGMLSQSNPALVQAPVKASENSYLDEIFKVTDGRVIRWGRFPLRVYIDTPKDNPLFKEEYKQAAIQGLNAWKDKTDGFVHYVEIKNPQAADIIIDWEDAYVDRFADPENVPTVYKNYTPPKRSRLISVVQMASMVTPGYFSLAPQAAAAAMQYRQYKKLEVIREESKIKLGLAPTKGLSPDAAKLLIQNMTAKEFGHALGLKAASPQKGDLLYPELRSDIAQLPSFRDLTTLKELYTRPPNIILNTR